MRVDLAYDEPEREPDCEHCGAPDSWCRCLPIVACPECGAEYEDVEGWGVCWLCDECGWEMPES